MTPTHPPAVTSGAAIAQGLVRNGIAARTQQIRAGERSTGAAILEERAAQGADLLLKGAYTHSRLRQMIGGGATSHILGAAELPVNMALRRRRRSHGAGNGASVRSLSQ